MISTDRELLDELVAESREHLAEIEPCLLALETDGDEGNDENINRIFRAVHSIKGGFGVLGVEPIQRFAHALENALARLRDGEIAATPALIDSLLAGMDQLQEMLDDVDNCATVDTAAVLEALQPWLSPGEAAEPTSDAAPAPEPAAPPPQHSPDDAAAGGFIPLRPRQRQEKRPATTPRGGGGAAASAGRRAAADVLRVKVELLDHLLDLAGELVLARNQLLQAGGRDGALPGVNATLQNLDAVTTALQENIMRTRLQPVDVLFGKLPRQVRELSRKTGKEVALVVEGREVELDKSIIEALADPLNHIVRNALDHGIEDPETRAAAGKDRRGRLLVRAYHESGQVNIQVRDDGRGIDPEVVRAKAVEKGIIPAERAAVLDEHDSLMLVMAPGFSTAAAVTDISGRGVGMDVVRNNIERLGGNIDIASTPGEGTCITLKLPLTLAIIPSLLVTCGDRRFAVPQAGIQELVRIQAGDRDRRVESVRGREVLNLRGSLIPLVHLAALLGMPSAGEHGGDATTNILVMRQGGLRYGLAVDTVLDNEEIVVKPLPTLLKASPCYAGATILGDGGVAMILDPAGIAERAGLRGTERDDGDIASDAAAAYRLRTESQTLLLFRNHPEELFALNLNMVSRIQQIHRADIRRVGEREFIGDGDDALRLIRLHDHLPVTAPPADPDTLYVIMPRLVKHPLGIVATRCEDVVTARPDIDRAGLTAPGILGTAMLEGRLTVFLDLYTLFEQAAPDLYARREDAVGATAPLRILLAEDTAFFRVLVRNYLETLGHHVTVAPDGQRAWETLQADPAGYDLLLTDLEMPVMDGLELIRRVRNSAALSGLPVVTLTSLQSDEIRQRVLDAGADAHELKLDKASLAATIAGIGKEVSARG